MTTKTPTKPTIEDVADAVHHGIPAFAARVEFAIPPRALVPVDLLPLLDDLEAAHAVRADKVALYEEAKRVAKGAKAQYAQDVDREVQPGANAAPTFDRTDAAAIAEKHAYTVSKKAQDRIRECHWLLTQAIADRKDEILSLIQPVAEQDAADEATAAAALAAARHRLAGVRSAQVWISEAKPGENVKRPHRT